MRILLWPFLALGALFGFILSALGRMMAFILGLVVCVLGGALCLTGIGLVLGIPMVIFGGGLMLRSIF